MELHLCPPTSRLRLSLSYRRAGTRTRTLINGKWKAASTAFSHAKTSAMSEGGKDIFPSRLSDLWRKRPGGIIDVMGDVSLYLDRFELDEVSSFIWQHCDGQTSAWDITQSLVKEIEDDPPPFEVILADVMEAMHDLRERKLLTWQTARGCDVLFVAPPYPTTYDDQALQKPEFRSPPLGLAYLAAYLREHGLSVAIQDMQIELLPPEGIVATCRAQTPKVVGITATTPTYYNALSTARFIKAWNPETVIVLGGVHAAAMTAESLADGPFDYIVLGEGEATMLELSQHLLHGSPASVRDVTGVAFLDEAGEMVLTPPRVPIQDLDALPFPARDLLQLHRYVKNGAICSSRGCPNNCNFCACHLIFGRHYRTPSVDRVLDEIEQLVNVYGINEIDFNDDTFNWNAQRVFDICDGIIQRDLKLRWSCFCRAAQMTPEIALAIKRAGCDAVQFGVESGSAKILEHIGKRTTPRQVEDAVKASADAGISAIVCGIMVGHPQDTVETVHETIDFAAHLLDIGATRIMLSLLTPYPGTDIHLQAEDLGIHILSHDWEQYILSRVVVETDNLPKETLRELFVDGLIRFLEHEKAMEKYWQAGRERRADLKVITAKP